MNNDKILNLIGLAMRSRKVTLGQDAVFAKLPNESLKMIFLASDAGNNKKKKLNSQKDGKFFKGNNNIKLLLILVVIVMVITT